MQEKKGLEDTPQINVMITVPKYTRSIDREGKNTVLYDLKFTELQTGYTFEMPYRFSELKKFHESLETIKVTLPKFPSTSWFFSTNNDERNIEVRWNELDHYFQNVISVKDIRESYLMKNFIQDAQQKRDKRIQQQKDKVKAEKKVQIALDEVNDQQLINIKSYKKFKTPAIKAQRAPSEERERALSFEEITPVAPRKVSLKSEQMKQVIIGGRGIMRGILQKNTHTKK